MRSSTSGEISVMGIGGDDGVVVVLCGVGTNKTFQELGILIFNPLEN